MRGCETCFILKQLQLTLNRCKKIQVSYTTNRSYHECYSFIFPKDEPLYNILDDGIKEMVCPLVGKTLFPQWKCVITICDCCPVNKVCN